MRKFGIFLAALLLLGSIPAVNSPVSGPRNAVAQEATAATATTTDRLNLRSGPSLADSVILVIPMGASVTLRSGESNGFRSLTYNGQDGWAFATFLSIDAPVPSPNTIATTTDRLNLRSGPATSYSVTTVIPDGAPVTLTGESSNGYRSATWGGFSGWVYAEFLDFESSTPPPVTPPKVGKATTTDALNLRTGPGISYPVIQVMPRGSSVVLTGEQSNGYRSISFNGRTGWAADAYLAIEGSVPVPSGTATAIDRLNLRSGPDTSSGVLTVIPTGGVVTLTGQASNGFRSVSYNGYDGWAFEAYLTIGSTTIPPTGPDAEFDVTNTIVGPKRGSPAEAMAFARANGALRLDEVERYVQEIYRLAPQVGFDPAILVAQSAHETGNWTSSWWTIRLNPAGIGVTGDPTQNNASPMFSNGMVSARAQIAHMHAEVFGSSRALPAILQGVDSTYQRVFEAGWAGTIRTIEDLAGTWAVDPDYHTKLVRKGKAIFD